MDPWRTAIVDARDGQIRIRGYDVASLMTAKTFTDTIFLLHQNRLPGDGERRLLDAILIGVADHGSGAPSCAAASGNRQSLSAAVAAGILAVGDEHGAPFRVHGDHRQGVESYRLTFNPDLPSLT